MDRNLPHHRPEYTPVLGIHKAGWLLGNLVPFILYNFFVFFPVLASASDRSTDFIGELLLIIPSNLFIYFIILYINLFFLYNRRLKAEVIITAIVLYVLHFIFGFMFLWTGGILIALTGPLFFVLGPLALGWIFSKYMLYAQKILLKLPPEDMNKWSKCHLIGTIAMAYLYLFITLGIEFLIPVTGFDDVYLAAIWILLTAFAHALHLLMCHGALQAKE